MFRSLILGGVAAVATVGVASAHAIFPGSAKVETLGERAIVQLHAVNARKDVTTFVVELFDPETWAPSRVAVAYPTRLTVLPQDIDSAQANERPFTVMVDLGGKPEQRVRMCTKSIPQISQLQTKTTIVNTRVCSMVTVQRFNR